MLEQTPISSRYPLFGGGGGIIALAFLSTYSHGFITNGGVGGVGNNAIHSRVINIPQRTTNTIRLNVATTPPPPLVNGDRTTTTTTTNGEEMMGWECDDELEECVEVPACNEEQCRTSLDVRIHGKWYDLSGWRKAHPAGSHWIDWYDGRDATDVMDAFHTKKARAMYQRLPPSKPSTLSILTQTTLPDTPTQMAFRELRDKLEDEGWWERDLIHESKLLAIFGGLCVGAVAAAHAGLSFVSICLLSVAMTNAGWLGHDYIHGVDGFCERMRLFAPLAGGLGMTWWSDKHNKHHALTNEMGVDEDIATDPFLYTWVPSPENDSPLRKIQHLIFYIPFSALFALWRVDTLKVVIDAVEQKRAEAKTELYALLIHYLVLLTVLPFNVWFPSIFVSGLITALIVTPTHQSEELFESYQSDWVTAQFESTRNAVTNNPFSEWVWGGMQYQLEHHLFPSMPRMNYPKLRPILMEFAKKHNIPGGYRESGEFEILRMNWELYKKVAEADPIPGAPSSRGDGQLGAISEGMSPAAAGFVPGGGGGK